MNLKDFYNGYVNGVDDMMTQCILILMDSHEHKSEKVSEGIKELKKQKDKLINLK